MQKPLLYRPVGGINSTLPADSIGETEVSSAVNFLFERQQALVRPGYNTRDVSSIAAQLFFVWGGHPLLDVITITQNGKFYKITWPGLTVTEITGAGITTTSTLYFAAGVNQAILIAGDPNGLIRWLPGDATYSVIASSAYQYVTSHFSRAIAAKGFGAGTDAVKVAWSTAGDETNWTGATAGSALLTDIADTIKGIGVIDNIVVIPTVHGFHLGYSTGVSTPAYRFETKIRTGPGPRYGGTIAFYNNVCYYVGQYNCYSFDLQTIKPIGDPIRDELMYAIARAIDTPGITYRGFVSFEGSYFNSVLVAGRAQYNLVPCHSIGTGTVAGTSVSTASLPHFAYNIEEGTWSTHRYDFSIVGGCCLESSGKLILHDTSTSPKLRDWDDRVECETPARLVGRVLVPDNDPTSDFTLQRVLLRYRNQSSGDRRITLSASAKLENELQVAVKEQAKDLGASSDPDWWRTMYDLRVTGNDFQYSLEVPANSIFALNMLGGKFAPGGSFR